VDLYAPELNFVFGEASSADRVAVISIARLYSMTSPEKDGEKMVERRAGAEAIQRASRRRVARRTAQRTRL
jgi:predicted Zn-dependent protease